MSAKAHNEQFRLGFMETIEVDGRGHIGGLLITNQNGRPLEFQCTTPVRPNRTQEILFGDTLHAWLLAELIGGTLLERVALKPQLVITGNPHLLELRNHTAVPAGRPRNLLHSGLATANCVFTSRTQPTPRNFPDGGT
jgi:hypothetical protein